MGVIGEEGRGEGGSISDRDEGWGGWFVTIWRQSHLKAIKEKS